MVKTPTQLISLAAFLKLPETKPASEYIDGQVIQKPMPQGEHSTLQRDLTRALDEQLSPTKIARAYPELRCTYPTGSHPTDVYGGRSIVPDISVYQWGRIPQQPNGRIANRFEVYPDWSIEILSPDQNHTKVTRNILPCLEYGTAMGWLIDADKSCVFVYQPNQTPKFFDQPQASLPTPNFATGVELTIERLFSWLMIE